MEKLAVVILAAGEGKRMNSRMPKVLHPICGRPMVQYAMKTTSHLEANKRIVVVGHQGERVADFLSGSLCEGDEILFQSEQLGTGDALRVAQDGLADFEGDVLILGADTPFLSVETLTALIAHHQKEKAAVTILTTRVSDPGGYGRIIRDKDGRIQRIAEEKDASKGELLTKEVNSGVYCFNSRALSWGLPRLSDKNAQGEFYLTDLIEMLAKGGDGITSLETIPEEVRGINDRIELARAGAIQRRRILDRFMLSGVSIINPETTFIEDGVEIGQDTIIHPFSMILGKSLIGEDCIIGPQAHIIDAHMGDGVTVVASFVENSVVGAKTQIGPFAHIRPQTNLGEEVRVGNFVEVKKSIISDGARMCHLTYIGDSFIGKKVNIGAGTITCNYDGHKKHCTTIEDEVFVGSNTAFVAPVKISQGAVIGAGSTITDDVPSFSLAVARANQKNIPEWARRRQKTEDGGQNNLKTKEPRN